MWETALLKAIQQFDSMQQFSEKLGVPRENVSAWLHKNVQIPLLYALRIEEIFCESRFETRLLKKEVSYFFKLAFKI